MTTPHDHPFPVAGPERLAPMREALQRAGYDEPAVLRLLGAARLPSFRQLRRQASLYLWRTRGGGPLDTLVRLFLLGEAVPVEAARPALAPAAPEEWEAVGLLRLDGDALRADFELTPFEGLLLAADWEGRGWDEVMGVAPTTRLLAQFTVRRRVGRALDLGTGCGALALLLSRHSGAVVASDRNPRAVALARFNAALNGVAGIDFREGDLFGPVGGEAFDLIVCNPPFVIGPARDRLHTNSGLPSDEISRAVVRGAPAHLAPGGLCQMVGNWACVASQDWRQRLAGWCEDGGCDAWVLHLPPEAAGEYVARRIEDAGIGPEEAGRRFDEWMTSFQAEGVEAVGFGVVTLRRTGAAPWFHCDAVPEAVGPCGEAVAEGLARLGFLEAHRDDRALLNCRLRRAAGLLWEVKEEASADGWSLADSLVRPATGLAFRLPLSADVVGWLGRCRGDRRLADQLRELAAAAKRPAEAIAPEFLKMVRRMVAAGLLVPA
jgi:methylase of polypeptide subunit release factors